MTGGEFDLTTGHGTRRVALFSYLSASDEERAAADAHAWIKRLRHAAVDGQPLRRRFTYRGDSLWWFAEIYLHKEQRILAIFRTLAALERMIFQERPRHLRLVDGGWITRLLAPKVAAKRGVRYAGPRAATGLFRRTRLNLRARWLHLAAAASRVKPSRGAAAPADPPAIAAFVHRAFWRTDAGEGSAEAYIGPVLARLEHRIGRGRMAYVGLGPASNFRARRWWHPLRLQSRAIRISAIESHASLARLADSRALWRERYRLRRALWNSADIRRRAVIDGCDCWPIVRDELSGIALLQWPWSARAMDEAAAALDAIQPRTVLTYAEAGGWGRALVLEARRRGIRSVGIQHGFIHRHWLNYLHEPDEMQPDPENPDDHGFPRPTLTLVFDEYTADHLTSRGRFPRDALRVTGSARLDALVAEASALDTATLDRVRARTGCGPEDHLALVTTKFGEARHVLPALIEAAESLPGVRLAIKTHPAETPDVYAGLVRGRRAVVVLPAASPLAPLLRACRVVVTMNSTVALDAAVLDLPAMVIGLPNNLSPFVDAGVLAGADGPRIPEVFRQVLYDEEFRRELERTRREYLARVGIGSDGHAAGRAANVVLEQSDVGP